MPHEGKGKHVSLDDEIVIYAGYADDCDSSHCFAGSMNCASSFNCPKPQDGMITTEGDLKQDVPFPRMRIMIIALALVVIALVIAYYICT